MATTTCAPCVFGALETSVLSYTAHSFEHITVAIDTYFTVFPNHSQTSTTSRRTLTETLALPSNASASPTFSNTDNITWTVGNATLTWPTTYVQYLQFAGAPATTDDGQLCAQQTDASYIMVPTSTDAASFIYPSSNATAGMPLPTDLLEYLDSFPEISSQFLGDDLTECAPLKLTALRTRAVAVPIQPAQPRRRFEGARTSGNQAPFVTPLVVPGGNRTIYPRDPSGYGTGTGGADTTTSPSSASLPENAHTTAFVINTISGRSIVVTQTGSAVTPPAIVPANSPSPSTPTPSPAGNGGGSSGSNTHLSNLLGNMQSAAIQGASPTEGSGSAGSQDLSNLLSNINNVATQDGNSGSQPAITQHHDSPAATPPVFTVGNSVISAGSDGTYTYAGSALAPGSTVMVGSGDQHTAAALQTSGGSTQLVVGGKTIAGSPPAETAAGSAPSQAVITANGQTITAVQDGSSLVLKDGSSTTTVPAGSPATFDGQTVSAASGGALIVNGQTVTPMTAQATGSTGEVVITTNGQTFTAVQSGSSLVLKDGSSTTAVPAGSAATFDGQTVSAASGGALVVNGQIVTSMAAQATSNAGEAVITAGGHTFTAAQVAGGSVVLKDGSSTTTVPAGSAATLDGQTVSAASGGALVVNGKTITLLAAQATDNAGEVVITAGGHTFTAAQAAGGSVLLQDASSTLTVRDGSVATFEGQTVIVASDGSSVVVGGSTAKLTSTAASSSGGIGGYIKSGLGGLASPTTSATAGAASPSATSGGGARSTLSWAVALLSSVFAFAVLV
ncbi:hypothetical protein LTR56_012659 [Elasticomyces elasticus]|nr:hypothetical protein LTR56_012659 [Elasticomyces elasticus]KAK3668284.1 hypothetical protein LTR22_000969 [Elasticomyces elasticus]KAK4922775.1 hypothetical protein LTR49_009963 [Elasticomyces elasticus]KAK5769391.1 hypothetical protein LTS12_000318 [Elasticomyces elasticus]